MDFSPLLEPMEGHLPSGVELRNESGFHEIARLLEPAARSARYHPDGSKKQSAGTVDWSDVSSECQSLAAKGRDLRLLVVLVRAAFNDNGFAGLADGLAALDQTLDQYWDSVHPQLRDRPDPKDKVTGRMNALKDLDNDDNGLLGDMKFSHVISPRGIGPVAGDDLIRGTMSEFEVISKASAGMSQAEKDDLVQKHGALVNRVSAATRAYFDTEPEQAATLLESLGSAQKALAALLQKAKEKSALKEGSEPPLSLPGLTDFLALSQKSLEAGRDYLAQQVQDDPGVAPSNVKDVTAAVSKSATPVVHDAVSGTIGSRKDVETSLDAIIGFYERTEPASPIPFLARRMRRMVKMDFAELMEEIAPSGMKEFRNVAGVEDAKKK